MSADADHLIGVVERAVIGVCLRAVQVDHAEVAVVGHVVVAGGGDVIVGDADGSCGDVARGASSAVQVPRVHTVSSTTPECASGRV